MPISDVWSRGVRGEVLGEGSVSFQPTIRPRRTGLGPSYMSRAEAASAIRTRSRECLDVQSSPSAPAAQTLRPREALPRSRVGAESEGLSRCWAGEGAPCHEVM